MEEESQRPPVTFSRRRTALTAATAVVLIAGALVIRPARPDAVDHRPPRAELRAMAAVGMGAPAAAADLGTLITDREGWLRAHPRDDGSWAVLGTAYLEQARRTADSGDFPRAEQALKRSLELRPAGKGNLEAMVGMGALANARRDFATGKRWGELVRAQSPGRWTAYPVLVDAYSGIGDYKAAEKAMEKLVSLRPGLAAYLRAAQVYRDRGWREDAMAAMEQASGAAKTPAEKAYVLYRTGELFWERGETAEALSRYEAALRTDPAQARALGGRARVLAALGRTGEAVADYRKALEKVPEAGFALELGELLESSGQREEAAEPYAVLRGLVAREAAHGVNETVTLGLFEADHGDPAAAVRVLRAEWGRAKSVQVADALGWALHRTGDDAAALEYATKATDPGLRSAEFAYHRAEIERALGDEAAARRHLQEALRTNPVFSPVRAPLAKSALEAIGQPAAGGPEHVRPVTPWVPPEMPKPKPVGAAAGGDAGAGAGADTGTDPDPARPKRAAPAEPKRAPRAAAEPKRAPAQPEPAPAEPKRAPAVPEREAAGTVPKRAGAAPKP
ncbi:tetratricopeptide repeat protein [Streptomyces sp. NPDC101118]|uniref:tetratricopeptide repeat protein n=1 Tax=Streptomyces sp. NPDC101118 TaxID=3366109 RepID=UPI00381D0718